MECPNCGNEGIAILIETFLCSHCEEELNIQYNVCEECEFAWKSMDDEPLREIVTDLGISEMFQKDMENFVKDVFGSEKVDIIELKDEDEDNMEGYIHRCLKCHELAFETDNPNLYKCCSCGFEWEVVAGV